MREGYPDPDGVELPMALPVRRPLLIQGDRFPEYSDFGDRRAVCRRCGLIMDDCEPSTQGGEFYHGAAPHQTRARRCRNHRGQFSTDDVEIQPFLRKSRRRFLKRAGIRP